MNSSTRAGHALRSSFYVAEEEPEPGRAEAAEASAEPKADALLLTTHIEAIARAHRTAAFAGLLSRWLRKRRR